MYRMSRGMAHSHVTASAGPLSRSALSDLWLSVVDSLEETASTLMAVDQLDVDTVATRWRGGPMGQQLL